MRAFKVFLTASAFATYFIGMVAFSAMTAGAIHAWLSPKPVSLLLATN